MKRLKSLQSPAVPPEVGDDEKEVWVSYNWLPLSACDSSYLGTDRLAFDSWALITESGLGARSIREPRSCQSYKRGSASPPYITGKLTIIGLVVELVLERWVLPDETLRLMVCLEMLLIRPNWGFGS